MFSFPLFLYFQVSTKGVWLQSQTYKPHIHIDGRGTASHQLNETSSCPRQCDRAIVLSLSPGYPGPAEKCRVPGTKIDTRFPEKRGSPLIERQSFHVHSRRWFIVINALNVCHLNEHVFPAGVTCRSCYKQMGSESRVVNTPANDNTIELAYCLGNTRGISLKRERKGQFLLDTTMNFTSIQPVAFT